jgi:hypothetical protein
LAVSVIVGACEPIFTSDPPEFVAHVDRPDSEPLLHASSNDVTAEFYIVDECALLIVTVPGHGEFIEEDCDEHNNRGATMSSAECAVVENEYCVESLPVFMVGSTLPGAVSVCLTVLDPGHPPGEVIDVRDEWWIVVASSLGGDVFPLDAEGGRLDSLQNEINDPVADACGL